MAFTVGSIQSLAGNVTTLDKIPVGSGPEIETMIGYQAGRLKDGYFVALLVDDIGPDHFDYQGTTLRSGGKSGLPGSANREFVQDTMKRDLTASLGTEGRADAHLKSMKARQLAGHNVTRGRRRLAKVLPSIRHNRALSDTVQYPAGGGALQWDLTKPARFLLAVYVDDAGVAHTASTNPQLTTLHINVAHGAKRLTARTALRKYMETA